MQLYRRYPDTQGLTDIIKIDPEKLRAESPHATDLSRPTVFFFPGFQTIDGLTIFDQHAETSLNLKSSVVEGHLGDAVDLYRKGELNFYTLTYSPDRIIPKRVRKILAATYQAIVPWAPLPKERTVRTGKLFDAATFLSFPETYYRQDAKEFAKQMILPALMQEDGNFLPKEEVMEKLRHITFVGDSYGSTFAHQLGNFLRYRLGKSKKHPEGFAPEEVEEMLRQIVFIGASNIVVNDKPGKKNPFTGIYFEGRGDRFIGLARKLENINSLVLPYVLSGKRFPETVIEDPDYKGIGEISDSGYYRSVKDVYHIIEAEQKHYTPTPEKDNLALRGVDKGMVVEFDVPTHFEVMLKDHGEYVARKYENEPERHQTYSYIYRLPTHRDHADLFGRALRVAVHRSPDREISAEELLTRDRLPHRVRSEDFTRADHAAVLAHSYIQKHLDQVVGEQLGVVREMA